MNGDPSNKLLGLIYFARVRPDGPIKIGVTGDGSAKYRLSGIQVGCPWPIDLIGCVKGDLNDERRLHTLLAPYRMIGEWFSPHEKVLETIALALKDGFPHNTAPSSLPAIFPTPDRSYLEDLWDRARAARGAVFVKLPPDLSLSVRLAAKCADVSVSDLIVDILMDVFPSAVSRETPSPKLDPVAVSRARSLLG